MDKYQQIRVPINNKDKTYRISAETDKAYKRVAGIHVSCYDEYQLQGMALGLKIGQQELFSDQHETKLLSCSSSVAPNSKFFMFESHIEAAGSAVEGRLSIERSKQYYQDEQEVLIYLWLTNDEGK